MFVASVVYHKYNIQNRSNFLYTNTFTFKSLHQLCFTGKKPQNLQGPVFNFGKDAFLVHSPMCMHMQGECFFLSVANGVKIPGKAQNEIHYHLSVK